MNSKQEMYHLQIDRTIGMRMFQGDRSSIEYKHRVLERHEFTELRRAADNLPMEDGKPSESEPVFLKQTTMIRDCVVRPSGRSFASHSTLSAIFAALTMAPATRHAFAHMPTCLVRSLRRRKDIELLKRVMNPRVVGVVGSVILHCAPHCCILLEASLEKVTDKREPFTYCFNQLISQHLLKDKKRQSQLPICCAGGENDAFDPRWLDVTGRSEEIDFNSPRSSILNALLSTGQYYVKTRLRPLFVLTNELPVQIKCIVVNPLPSSKPIPYHSRSTFTSRLHSALNHRNSPEIAERQHEAQIEPGADWVYLDCLGSVERRKFDLLMEFEQQSYEEVQNISLKGRLVLDSLLRGATDLVDVLGSGRSQFHTLTAPWLSLGYREKRVGFIDFAENVKVTSQVEVSKDSSILCCLSKREQKRVELPGEACVKFSMSAKDKTCSSFTLDLKLLIDYCLYNRSSELLEAKVWFHFSSI
ncbi:hypothetical protein Ciccas_012849 [Cichlidogyrus casuarinus]|uniref:Uncharacterized protein n=1 Tax=Cichlidogyrus casuarinus TaxID=1844966 RepID=A0ABD2PNZ9_9PLAT